MAKDKSEDLKYPKGFIRDLQDADINTTSERKVWDLALLFLDGKQWLNYNDVNVRTNRATPYATNRDNKVTVNLLINIYRNILSKLSVTYPSISILPASPSTEDVLKAQSSELAIKYYWNKDQLKLKFTKAFEWLISCGTVGMHTYYDPRKDTVSTEVVSPFDLMFESDVDSIENSDYIGVRRHVLKHELERSFPKFKKEIKLAVDSLDNSSRPGEASLSDIPSNRLEIFEIYWRDGKHAILMGETYLYKGHYDLEDIPIQVMKYTDVPGKLWGIGLIAPLLDMQWLYNKSRSQVLQNIELMSNPKWLVPKTSGILQQQITNRPGEKIYYNAAGGAPTQIGAAPLPSHVFDNITRLQSEMMDVSGVHSTSLGKRAVGISSGKAIETLAAQDMSQLQITQLMVEEATKNLARDVLVLMRTFYKEAKMIRMLDDAGKVVFKQLQQTDLIEDPEIFIEAGSLFRSESMDRDAKILEMLQLGLVTPDMALKELSFKTGNSFIVEKMEAMSHAMDLLKAAQQGYDIEIFKTDDIQAFKGVFGGFIKSPDYYRLPTDRQEYIRDVYIAIEQAGMTPENLAEANIMDKVYPRQSQPNTDQRTRLQGIMGNESQAAQQQALQESLAMESISGGFDIAEEALTRQRGAEALITPRGGPVG